MKIHIFVLSALVLCAAQTRGADPLVISFDNGILVWTNPATALQMFSVEWTHALPSNTWQSGWDDQSAIVTTASVVSVPVPMYYRVAQGFDNRAFEGVWVAYHEDGVSHFKADGKGLLNESGPFALAAPAGHYEVNADGTFDMSIYDRDERIEVSGHRLDASTWQYVYQSSTGVFRRVENPGALAGEWRGTIGPYTNVRFSVRSDGFIPVITNLVDESSGSLFEDGIGTVAGSFYTGAEECSTPWSRFAIRATRITPDRIFGDYELDWEFGWITAGVDLRRQ